MSDEYIKKMNKYYKKLAGMEDKLSIASKATGALSSLGIQNQLIGLAGMEDKLSIASKEINNIFSLNYYYQEIENEYENISSQLDEEINFLENIKIIIIENKKYYESLLIELLKIDGLEFQEWRPCLERAIIASILNIKESMIDIYIFYLQLEQIEDKNPMLLYASLYKLLISSQKTLEDIKNKFQKEIDEIKEKKLLK